MNIMNPAIGTIRMVLRLLATPRIVRPLDSLKVVARFPGGDSPCHCQRLLDSLSEIGCVPRQYQCWHQVEWE